MFGQRIFYPFLLLSSFDQSFSRKIHLVNRLLSRFKLIYHYIPGIHFFIVFCLLFVLLLLFHPNFCRFGARILAFHNFFNFSKNFLFPRRIRQCLLTSDLYKLD